MLKAASAWSKRLRSEAEAPGALDLLIDRVELRPDGIQLSIKLPTESSEKSAGRGPVHLKLARLIPKQTRRRGVEMKFVVNGDSKALQNELMPCKSKPSESPSGPKHPDWPRAFRGHSSCSTIDWRLPNQTNAYEENRSGNHALGFERLSPMRQAARSLRIRPIRGANQTQTPRLFFRHYIAAESRFCGPR
jgi:hypothetical protein